MSALTSLLVRDQVVSVRKIEEAIQRQVMSGGELETVLLEMDAVPEDVMSAYRAALFGLLPATRDEVMRASREVIRLVPRDVALQYKLVPLSAEKRTLVVAVTAPLKPDVDEQLGFLLGHELVYRIVTEARLVAGLGHHYGLDVPPRVRRLADKLRQRDPGVVPYVAPQEEKIDAASGELPRKKLSDLPSMIDWGDEDEEERTERVTRKQARLGEPVAAPPPPAEVSETAPTTPGRRRAPKPSSPLLRRLRGPLTPQAAVELLDEANDRDEIIEVLFGFARQFFDWSALFVVHDDVADGREAWGAGLDTEQISRIAVPLDVPGSFAEVREGKLPRVVDLSARQPDRVVAHELARDETQPALLVPIAIRDRVVLMLYGDRGGEAFEIVDLPELIAFLPRIADAFQRLILRKKKGSGYGGSSGGGATASLKSAAGRMGAAPKVRSQPASYRPAPTEGAARLVSALGVGNSGERETTSTPGTTPSDPEDLEGPAVRDTLRARKKRPRIDTQPRPPIEGPLGVLGVPRSAPPPPMPVATDDDGPVQKTTRPDGAAAAAAVAARAQLSAPFAEPVRRRDTEPEEDRGTPAPQGGGAYSMREAAVDVLGGRRRRSSRPPPPKSDPPPLPAKRSTNRPPRLGAKQDPRREVEGASIRQEVVRLPKGTPELEEPLVRTELPTPADGMRRITPASGSEPSVIVDMGDTVEALVDDLVQCGPDDEGAAVEALAHVGEASLPALVQRFPGPLWFDRHQPHKRLPRGRDISAVARAIVRFGERSVPYVASLVGTRDDDARFYAVLLSSELVRPELIAPLAQRIFDEDQGTRTLSLDVLRLFARYERAYEEMLKGVRVEARVDRGDHERQLVAIRALGELRDARSVEILVGLLESERTEITEAAHAALVTITRQDFGASARKWTQWLERNQSRHRIEWLIDGLVHTDETIRAAAGDELKVLTQQYYGYHPASPKRDREIAQRKYRAWWEGEGQRRFETR